MSLKIPGLKLSLNQSLLGNPSFHLENLLNTTACQWWDSKKWTSSRQLHWVAVVRESEMSLHLRKVGSMYYSMISRPQGIPSTLIELPGPAFPTCMPMCIHAQSLQLCPTVCDPMDCIRQASPSVGFCRQEYWSGLPCPAPGDLPNPGIKPTSAVAPALQAYSLLQSHWGSPLSTYTRPTILHEILSIHCLPILEW